MATAIPFGWTVQNAAGTAVSGAKIYFTIPGTSTPRSPFTDSGLTVPSANPVVADAAGYFLVYLSSELAYDIVVKSADDSITYQERRVASNIAGAQPVDATLTMYAALGITNGKSVRGTGVDTGELFDAADTARTNTFTEGQLITLAGSDTEDALTVTVGGTSDLRTTDAVNGYVGIGSVIYVAPDGTGDASIAAIAGRSIARNGTRGIMVGVSGYGEASTSWAKGSGNEAGAIGGQFTANTSKAGTVFGVNANVDAITTDGALVRIVEFDVNATANAASKIGIELVSTSTDTGTTSGTVTADGGATVPDEAAIRVNAISTGKGFDSILMTMKPTGGSQPVPTAGRLWMAGGFTTTYGLDWRSMTFSAAVMQTGNYIVNGSGAVGFGTTSITSGFMGDFRGRIKVGSGNSSGDAEIRWSRYADTNPSYIVSVRSDVGVTTNGLKFLGFNSGASFRAVEGEFVDTGGLILGNPTGGGKGTGTLNAIGVYDDNTLLTDLVLDQFIDGTFDAEKYAAHPIAAEMTADWFDPDAYAALWVANRHLPGMVQFTPEDRPSTGELITRLTAVVETQAVLIEKLNQRLKSAGL